MVRTGPKLKVWALNLTYILWPISLLLGPLIHSLSNKFWYGILYNLSFALKLLKTSPSAYFIKINHLPQTLSFYCMSVNHPPLPPCYPHHISAINFTCWSQWFLFGCHYELTPVPLSSKLSDMAYPKKPSAGKGFFFKMIINYFVLLIEYQPLSNPAISYFYLSNRGSFHLPAGFPPSTKFLFHSNF